MESNNIIENDISENDVSPVLHAWDFPRKQAMVAVWHKKKVKQNHPPGWLYCKLVMYYIPQCKLITCNKSSCSYHPMRCQ